MTTATTRVLRAAVAIAIVIGVSRLQGQIPATTPPATRDGLPIATPEALGMSTERLRRVHDVVRQQIEAGTISGAVTLVARDGRVVHFEAHGLRDVEARAPMTKDTIFRIASMTKPITGVAVLMMVEQGKVRLDDPLSRFIPEFKNMTVATGAARWAEEAPVESVPASREITIRDPLTHTAGLVTVNGLVAQRPVWPRPG